MTISGVWLAASLMMLSPVTTKSVAASFSPIGPSNTSTTREPATDTSTGPAATFTVSDEIAIPGKTLSSGAYTIRVLDHLRDRMIIRVDRKGKVQSTFLALPKSNLSGASGNGPIQLGSGSKAAMRGFVFSDGTVAEFVFPKAEAVALAKSNATTIPAVDPASEGRPDTSKLSNEDMQMVTLWMLTPTTVGPNDSKPGIAAAKYQVPQEVASSHAPQRPGSDVQPRPKPIMSALPHTASDMPAVELAGVLAFGAACWLTRRRITR